MGIGIAFTPFETRADVITRIAVQADQLGLDRVDIAEGWTHDGTILLAEVATRTERIALGSSVVSVWGRSPATLALMATGLQRLSDGRFSLGIGAGSPPLAEGLHGRRWERPVAHLRETINNVRALLAGERLPDPAARARPLRIGVTPDVPVPLSLAALSPASIRLAGELADAWTPFLWARSRIDEGRALLREGSDSRSTRVAMGVPVALAPDEDGARSLAAWWLSAYTSRMGPIYPRMLAERFGMAAGVAAIAEGDRAGGLPEAAEELAGEVTLMGTYERAGEAIGEWFAAGADDVQLVLPPGRPEEELFQIVWAAACVAKAAGALT